MKLLDLRVKPAMDTETDADLPSFVERDRDQDLEWSIAQGGIVLLHGRAASGKTRVAAEAIHRLRPHHDLVVPRDGVALRNLVDSGIDLSTSVVWLDDLERFLAPGGLDVALLHRLSAQGVGASIVATMRDDVLAHYNDAYIDRSVTENALVYDAVELIQGIRGRWRIRIDRHLSENERAKAKKIPDHRVQAALKSDDGFAEYLVAGRAMLGRWSTGDGALFQVGQAVISAAVDCRRAGYHKPVPSTVLRELHVHYLGSGWRQRADIPSFREGLKWSTKIVLGANSCLQPQPDDTFLAADYLVDSVDDAESPIARCEVVGKVWDVVLALCEESEAVYIGLAAQQSKNSEAASQAFHKGAGIGDTHAMNHLAELSNQRGDVEQAEKWWGEAANAGNETAMHYLGELLLVRGEYAESEFWLRKVVKSDLGPSMIESFLQLADLFIKNGQDPKSVEKWRKDKVANYRNPMYSLGSVLFQRGKIDESLYWYAIAAEAGYREAMYDLGVLLFERGENIQAEYWWSKAAEVGSREAMYEIGLIADQGGDKDSAEELWRESAAGGVEKSMQNLGVLLIQRGEYGEAEIWCRKAAEGNDEEAMINGMLSLGGLLAIRGAMEEAEFWLRKAIEAGSREAGFNLGVLAYRRGDKTEAEELWNKAAKDGSLDAAKGLAELVAERDCLAESETWNSA
ncbi:tetratricopeptide repeat protein [Saccharopolyspora sp. NFXS83]|uniref:tetratricopeptide repeat protein n=1 Tax=Saccharopolyspora sp. NFXS83 TaxID=2993560 RepID=UPI00224B623A|nr:tetratricopeptide repeat protein [Saccharopolyspora sp. NFXS83]MCX2728820.1 tetratricopeptide repeat protein [Saccharopolyspora sp. NFXS83]